ncbi:MAG: GNAT family protein [Sterolibacterium sp.]|nr:GNAT family protein [Sterolibacterium sp.]
MNSFIYRTERIAVCPLDRWAMEGPYPSWFHDMEVCRHNSHGAFPKQAAELAAYIDSLAGDRSRLVWAIFDVAGAKPHIGNISLQQIDPINRSAEFAILIGDRSCWGKGYSAEAARLLLTHGFDRLNLRRIYCGTASTNAGMRGLAQTLGMVEEGTRRGALFIDGNYIDVVEYGLLRDEFRRPPA